MKPLIDADIQKYAHAHGITGSGIISKISGELEQLSFPGFQASYRSGRANIFAERERALALKDLHSAPRLAEAFKGGDVISSILPEYIKGNIPSFNIVGAIIETPEDFAKLTWALRSPYMEVLKVAFLNRNGKVVHSATLSVGSINEAMVHPQMILREVQRLAEKTKTNRIIISHNHPSGNPQPSAQDISTTRVLVEALQVAKIEILDHVITNGKTYSSWKNGWGVASLEMPQPDWEMVPRTDLPKIETPMDLKKVVASLRQADPEHDHVIYGDVKLHVAAVERLPASLTGNDLALRVAHGSGREGALNVWFESAQRTAKEVTQLGATLEKIQITLLDAGTPSVSSFKTAGLLIPPEIVKEENRPPPGLLAAKAIHAVKSACREAMSSQQGMEAER